MWACLPPRDWDATNGPADAAEHNRLQSYAASVAWAGAGKQRDRHMLKSAPGEPLCRQGSRGGERFPCQHVMPVQRGCRRREGVFSHTRCPQAVCPGRIACSATWGLPPGPTWSPGAVRRPRRGRAWDLCSRVGDNLRLGRARGGSCGTARLGRSHVELDPAIPPLGEQLLDQREQALCGALLQPCRERGVWESRQGAGCQGRPGYHPTVRSPGKNQGRRVRCS